MRTRGYEYIAHRKAGPSGSVDAVETPPIIKKPFAPACPYIAIRGLCRFDGCLDPLTSFRCVTCVFFFLTRHIPLSQV